MSSVFDATPPAGPSPSRSTRSCTSMGTKLPIIRAPSNRAHVIGGLNSEAVVVNVMSRLSTLRVQMYFVGNPREVVASNTQSNSPTAFLIAHPASNPRYPTPCL